MRNTLETLAEGRDLLPDQAHRAFEKLMKGEVPEAQAGAFLMGLRTKGETPVEMNEAVMSCMNRAVQPEIPTPCIDFSSISQKEQCTFHCCTAASLVLAAMGHNVVKYESRSQVHSCSGADVLRSLGIRLDVGPDDVVTELTEKNFAYLDAGKFHPQCDGLSKVRGEIGIDTVFSKIRPFLNPVRPTHQIIGVGDHATQDLMAETVLRAEKRRSGQQHLVRECVAVVNGAGGFDELNPFGPCRILWVEKGEVEEMLLDPASLGLSGGRPGDVNVLGPTQAYDVMVELLDGRGHLVMQHMVTLNIALGLMVLGAAESWQDAVFHASGALMSGDAARKFNL